jgi:hypothetical protein
MNCFEHPQKPAVGACTHCGRGLCKECTTVVEGQLSCRGRCQDEVTRKRQLMLKSERAADERTVIYGTSAKMYQQSFASAAFFGLLLIIIGSILLYNEDTVPGAFLVGLGMVLGIRSAGLARAGKKYKSLAENRTEAQADTK